MTWFKKKEDIGAESKVFAGNTSRFYKVRDAVQKSIKEGNLTDDLVQEYIHSCEAMIHQLKSKESKEILKKENSKLSDDNFTKLIASMKVQITWGENELAQREKIRDLNK